MPTGDKTSMQARLSYARVLVEVWELDDAEAQLAGVLEEWPDEVTALDLLAKIKHIRGELTEAIACWAQVHARSSPKQAGAHLRLNSLLQLARDTERGGRDFLVLGPYQLWRKPAAHLELEEVFRLFLARRPDEARARCDQLARKYHGKDQDLYKLAVLANAWIAELSGDLDRAQSILEELGSERGFENDKDRLLALARLYEKVGATELLRKAVNIYLHFERDYETVSALGNLSVLYLRLGDEGEAARYHRRFLDLFRRRMHRPTLAEAIQVSAIRYVPLYKLCKIRFAGTDGLTELAPRERAIGLALAGDRDGSRELLQGGKEPLDIKYRADLAVLDGSCEEAVSLYIESLRADPHSPRVIGWLLAQHARSQSTQIAKYFKQGEVAERTFEILEAAIRSSPLRASLWRQKGVLHQILGQAEEAGRCFERSAALQEAAQRESSPVGRVLAAAVYHLVGKPKGLIHEVWAERKPAGPGRGGFLEEILGSLTQEMTQAVRNTFLSVREYARAKWPQQTHDILDYNYTYKVTKEDEPSGGLSAGLPSALAFLSVFLDRPVPQNIASSGVLVADSHDVLSVRPVGEPEYKVRGAYNRNLQRLILPVGNRKDLKNNPRVPAEVCEEIVRYASDLDDAVVLTFGEDIWIR